MRFYVGSSYVTIEATYDNKTKITFTKPDGYYDETSVSIDFGINDWMKLKKSGDLITHQAQIQADFEAELNG